MTQRLRSFITKGFVGILIALLIGATPVSAFADTADPSDPSQASQQTPADPPADPTPTPVSDPVPTPDPAPVPDPTPDPAPAVTQQTQQVQAPQNTQGPSTPPGPSSKTYHFNSATGLWENDFYTWNPTTGKTTPKQAPNYSYNPNTGMWDTTQWVYNAPSGKYVPNVVSTTAPPTGLNGSINNTGPDSVNQINDGSNVNGTFDNFYNASISNSLSQTALSGDASVLFNTTGGNATTGNATNVANLINLLQSATNLLGDNFTTFNADINGNVQGDLMLDPGQFKNVQANDPPMNNLTVRNAANGQIDNDIDLASATGNATIKNNTTGGNATTGDANAVANLVNVINSAVTDGQSFLGVLNIYGNLDGDILLPPDMLNALIASSGPDSTNKVTGGNENNLNANLTNNQSIDNNVTANAATGTANVSGNTTGGNAKSGDANTNVTLLNLTGHDVTAANSMLVFVNVLGKWVGLIMDAPAGSNAAALAGGVTNNSLNGLASNTDINSTSNSRINNNINLDANSGDADVSHNTTGGNATSGNATASANIANIENSNLSLSGWFGVLFINVFGTWNGSFGVNTAAGNAPATTSGTGNDPGKVIQFNSTQSASSPSATSYLPLPMGNVVDSQNTANDNNKSVVLGTTDKQGPTKAAPITAAHSQHDWSIIAFGLTIGAILLGTERLVTYRNKRRQGYKPFVKPVIAAGSAAEEE